MATSLNALMASNFYKNLPPEIPPSVIPLFTTFKMECRKFDKRMRDIVYSQNLTKLEITCLDCCTDNCKDYFDFAYGGYEDHDIIDTLKKLLNPTSRKLLKQLSIRTNSLTVFPNSWSKKVVKLLPSLISLDIGQYCLEQPNFLVFCSSFRYLVNLDLYSTRITNLRGIALLQDLQILGLCDVQFETKEALQELSQLKKLRVLDISGYLRGVSRTFGLLSEANIILPELRFLDISNTDVTFDNLCKFYSTHPNLVQVNVIDTSLQDTEQFEFLKPHQKILNIANLKSCIGSLQFYNSSLFSLRIYRILSKIAKIIRESYAEQNVDEMEECLKVLIQSINSARFKEDCFDAVKPLYQLCRDGRHKKYAMYNVELLTHSICEAVAKIERGVEGFFILVVEADICALWSLLRILLVVVPTQKYIDCVVKKGCIILMNENDLERKTVQGCIRLLIQFLKQASPDAFTKHRALLDHILEFMEVPQTVQSAIDKIEVIELMLLLNEKNTTSHTTTQTTIVSRIMVCFKKFQNNVQLQMKALSVLESAMIHLTPDAVKECFTTHCSSVFLPLLRPQVRSLDVWEATISLLLTMFSKTEGSRYNEDDAFINSKSDNVSNIMTSLMQKNYELWQAPGRKNFCKVLVASFKHNELIRWAEWIAAAPGNH